MPRSTPRKPITKATPPPTLSIRQYLLNLKWDGIQRIDRQDNRIPRGPALGGEKIHPLRALMLGAVQRQLRPGTKLNVPMVVIGGGQGIGKSSLLAALAGDHFENGIYDFKSVDAALAMSKAWIVEVHTDSANTATLKAFLDATEDTFRPPYRREAVTHPRSALPVVVTTEDIGASVREPPPWSVELARRCVFWNIVQAVRVEEIKRDRDQLWAEAVATFIGSGKRKG